MTLSSKSNAYKIVTIKLKPMHIKTILLMLLSATLITLSSQAKPEREDRDGNRVPPTPDQIIERLDSDGSGSITEDEAKGFMAKYFERIDANSDGEISEEELLDMRENRGQKPKQGREVIKAADTDQNAAISKDEATEAGLKKIVENFDKIDTDGDGQISEEEMHQLRKQMGKRGRDTQ